MLDLEQGETSERDAHVHQMLNYFADGSLIGRAVGIHIRAAANGKWNGAVK